MKKVLIVDDHDIVRFGLKSLLLSFERNVEIHEADTIDSARLKLKMHRFDLVVVDYGLPDETGFELIKTFREESKFIVFSMQIDHLFKSKALEVGAIDFVSKNQEPAIILKVLRKHLLNEKIKEPKEKLVINTSLLQSLSAKETEVFELLIQYKNIKEIAFHLEIAYTTAQTYKKRIFEKLNIHSQNNFVEFCVKNKLIH